MLKSRGIDLLIVDQNKHYAQNISSVIKNLGFNVVACLSSGQSAIDIVKEKKVDVALIDVDLRGDMDGIECAHILKNNFDTKSIILSEYDDEETLSCVLDLSPEFFLVKPYKQNDLKMAISLISSKFKKEIKKNKNIDLKKEVTQIKIDKYILNLVDKKLYFDGYEILLSKKEYKLIELFFKYPNEILPYDKIKNHIWKDNKMNKNSLINLISNLRKKLEYLEIKNINAQGYYLKSSLKN